MSEGILERFSKTPCHNRPKVSDLVAGVQKGSLSVAKVAYFFREQTLRLKDELGTHLSFDIKAIEAEVSRVQALVEASENPEALPLAGVPVLIKDNIATKDSPTTAGSRLLENYASGFDATVVERLRGAGALIFGKANLDEFGMGSSGENSAFQRTRHPTHASLVPGGSSSGSASAVAAGLVPLALGTDTGGSVRQPASHCGIVGLRPTYGGVSRYGVVAFASSFDQVGPIGVHSEDVALLWQIIEGADPKDQTSWANRSAQGSRGLETARIGILEEHADQSFMAEDVATVWQNALGMLTGAKGLSLGACSIPALKHGVAIYYVLSSAEASSNLARFDGSIFGKRSSERSVDGPVPYRDFVAANRGRGLGLEAKLRVLLGSYVLSAGYKGRAYQRASASRQAIVEAFEKIFECFDFVIGVTVPETAPKRGGSAQDSLRPYEKDLCTTAAAIAGIPAISIPCGKTAEGLPVGLQIMGAWHREASLLALASRLQNLFQPALGLGG